MSIVLGAAEVAAAQETAPTVVQTIDRLEAENAAQARRIEELERKVDALIAATADGGPRSEQPAQRAEAPAPPVSPQRTPAASSGTQDPGRPAAAVPERPVVRTAAPSSATRPAETQQRTSAQVADATPETVGERPSEAQREPRFDIFSDRGGILTPKGGLVIEPVLTYATSTDNRFFFNGIELVDAFLIGTVNAVDAERTSVSFSQTLRYGINGRLETSLTVPVVYTNDRRFDQDITSGDGSTDQFDRSGAGLGDIAGSLHYQLNAGQDLPYLISNLRVKSDTGEGPFDVPFDDFGSPLDAATGSGYWSVEPSLTIIKPVDPAVIFANIGYQFNLGTDIDQTIGDSFFHRFDPGDAIRTSFGVGLAINELVSVNFGYDQSYVLPTETVIVGAAPVADGDEPLQPEEFVSEREGVTIGSLLFGFNYRPARKVRIGITTSIGATERAPDLNLTLRGRYQF